jgi:hypothetical protein
VPSFAPEIAPATAPAVVPASLAALSSLSVIGPPAVVV